MDKYKKIIEFDWSEYDIDLSPNSVRGVLLTPIFLFLFLFLYIFAIPSLLKQYYTKRKIYYKLIKTPSKSRRCKTI